MTNLFENKAAKYALIACSFLLFTTNKSSDEFKKEVDDLGFQMSFSSSIDGYSLFSELNNHTEMKLTVDGNDTRGIRRLQIKCPSAKGWLI
jgi:hypothetical protein